jgi:hypothetical protein
MTATNHQERTIPAITVWPAGPKPRWGAGLHQNQVPDWSVLHCRFAPARTVFGPGGSLLQGDCWTACSASGRLRKAHSTAGAECPLGTPLGHAWSSPRNSKICRWASSSSSAARSFSAGSRVTSASSAMMRTRTQRQPQQDQHQGATEEDPHEDHHKCLHRRPRACQIPVAAALSYRPPWVADALGPAVGRPAVPRSGKKGIACAASRSPLRAHTRGPFTAPPSTLPLGWSYRPPQAPL